MDIAFTQFLRPDGRQKETTTPCPEGYEAKVSEIIDTGGKFEIEVLQTGDVSMTVDFTDPELEEHVWAHEICANGPAIDAALVRLIDRAYMKAVEFNREMEGVN